MCAAVYCVLKAELLVYLTKVIQEPVCICVVIVGGRALDLSDQDYIRAGGRCTCVLLCIVC